MVTSVTTPRRRTAAAHNRTAYVFLLPFLVLFGLFFIIPIGYAIWQSLFTVQRSGLGLGGAQSVFAGLSNYLQVVTDPDVITSVIRMLVYGVVTVPLMLVLSLSMALLFDAGVARLAKVFQFIAFAPYAVPGVIAAILWGFLYLSSISPIVQGLGWLGIHVDFLAPGTVLWSIGNMGFWQYTGYNMLIVFAALQAIPHELYEAARIDGASGRRIAWSIKIPIVRPALVLTVFFSIIGTFQMFSEPMVLKSLTSAITSTYTPNMAAYSAAFSDNDPNYASAIAVTLAVVTFVLSFGFQKIAQRKANA